MIRKTRLYFLQFSISSVLTGSYREKKQNFKFLKIEHVQDPVKLCFFFSISWMVILNTAQF